MKFHNFFLHHCAARTVTTRSQKTSVEQFHSRTTHVLQKTTPQQTNKLLTRATQTTSTTEQFHSESSFTDRILLLTYQAGPTNPARPNQGRNHRQSKRDKRHQKQHSEDRHLVFYYVGSLRVKQFFMLSKSPTACRFLRVLSKTHRTTQMHNRNKLAEAGVTKTLEQIHFHVVSLTQTNTSTREKKALTFLRFCQTQTTNTERPEDSARCYHVLPEKPLGQFDVHVSVRGVSVFGPVDFPMVFPVDFPKTLKRY
eukprot:6476270-Amphidinium_carterae.2